MGMGMGMVGLLPDHTIIPLLTVQDDHHGGGGGGGGGGGHHGGGGGGQRGLPAAASAPAPIHFWPPHDSATHQHQQQQLHFSPSYLKKPAPIDHSLDRIFANPATTAEAVTVAGIGASSGATTCQDCGNQAKKDCSHRRCRTCCKSRGFECSTHVKSTWVPAARRRERQVHAAGAGAGSSASASTSTTKKPRLVSSNTTTSHTSTSNTTPPRSFDSGSSHQDASFRESLPGQVRAPAVFKCVRVTAIDDGEDEYAYQAVVKIGGHVFKGFLYDQGVDSKGEAIPNLSDLHLGGAASATRATAGGSSSPPVIDPSDVYAASAPPGLLLGGGGGGGSSFGNPIN